MDKDREKMIGSRLRAFREALQIPRTKFALTIGFGGERIASYETGRVPLPYEVARSVMKHYRINLLWLATNEGMPRLPITFENEKSELAKPRALFSEFFDTHLAADLQNKKHGIGRALVLCEEWLSERLAILGDESIHASVKESVVKQLEPFIYKANAKLPRGLPIAIGTDREINLTKEVTSLTSNSVTPVLPKLIKRLNDATKNRGSKSALAEWLGVHRQSVTDWLSGKQEPGGEITLRLLQWVEQQERKK
ncbi:MAG: hypothetical protein WDN00_00415 [Limisphaerales bacterium]